MSSTDYVELNVGQVTSPGLTTAEESAFSELVRSLSSFGRAVVKYLPSDVTLLRYVQEAFQDAEKTVLAELHFDNVCQEFAGEQTAMENKPTQQHFATKVARIVRAKTKRIKQHSRRATARATSKAKQGAGTVQGKAKWPTLIAETAENIGEWKVDLFMHVAMLVVSEYFETQGFMVNRTDELRSKQQQKQIKKLIHFHAAEVGVDRFELKGFAFISRATGLLVKPAEAHQSMLL